MIIDLGVSLLAVAGFAIVLWKSRIVLIGRKALATSMTGLGAMLDSELDDDAKEIAVKQAGIGLIAAAFGVFWRFAAALAAALVPIYVADLSGLTTLDDVITLMMRLDYIVIITIVAVLVTEVIRRRNPPASASTQQNSRYSTADRFFHIFAFSSPVVLKSASWIEDRTLNQKVKETAGNPIFITSLARGGTTALLNALHDLPTVATHTYRDMPFLTAPVLWNRLAGGQNRKVERRERDHGDGLEIELDSPEAFEEVLWKMYWPEKFHNTSIDLWGPNDRKAAAEAFITRQFEKVMYARRQEKLPGESLAMRYCSKNNANVARIPYLIDAFPDCRIVVPLRRPDCHAASLLRQHENFLKRQGNDDFLRRYMRDIGHFEFGQIIKAIRFPGFDAAAYDSTTGDYWLNYLIHAYRFMIKEAQHCIFVLQDDLRDAPQETMLDLCDELGLEHGNLEFAPYFRSTPDRAPSDLYSPSLLAEAGLLYEELAHSRHPNK